MQFLIDFYNTASDQDITNYLQNNSCTVLKQWNNFDKIYLVECSSVPGNDPIVERIVEENPLKIKPLDVIPINPNVLTHSDPNDPKIVIAVGDDKDWWKNYSYVEPSFDDATLTISRLGKNVKVYIMDSGIDSTHPEFSDTNITNLYSVTPNDYSDNNGHGTALASVIAGKTCGISSADLKIVKIFDPNHATLQSEFLDALDAIIEDHIDNTYSVLNCSWIIEKNEWVEHKLRILIDEGVWVLAAAGNRGTSIEDVTPASMPEVVTVGAYGQNLLPCDFSNYTAEDTVTSVTTGTVNRGELDGWAPGEKIYVAMPGGGYGFTAGTSIATAISSGIMASNIHWYVEEDGTKSTGMGIFSTAILGAQTFLFPRENILDLSDPKYADSVNRIATIRDLNSVGLVQAVDSFQSQIREGEKRPVVRIFQPRYTKQIEIIDPLPANFEFTIDGMLYGTPVIGQGPTNGELYRLYNCNIKRTNIDDTVEDVNIKIYILPENYNPITNPPDEALTILLQRETCFNFPGVPQCNVGFAEDCEDLCQPGTICCTLIKVLPECLCRA
jgi:hypothetical protein